MSLSSLQMQMFLSRHKSNSFSILGPGKISFEAQPKQAYNQGTHILEITLNNLENVTLTGLTTYLLNQNLTLSPLPPSKQILFRRYHNCPHQPNTLELEALTNTQNIHAPICTSNHPPPYHLSLLSNYHDLLNIA